MANTPKHITVSVNADELQKLETAYKERIDRQRNRIVALVEFLAERGLLETFNKWEESRRA